MNFSSLKFKYKEEVAKYKKVLAGLLLEIQEQAFRYSKILEKGSLNENELIEIYFLNSTKVKIPF